MCFKRRLRKNEYQKKLNNIDKLLMRIFFSSFLLFSLLVIDKIDYNLCNNFIHSINDNINFLKYTKMFNGVFGNIIPVDEDITVDNQIYYDVITFDNNKNIINNYTYNGVNCISSGVVTKISKNKNNKYSVTIKSDKDINYTYENLYSCDLRIYSYVMVGDIIGEAEYDSTDLCYVFNLIIEKNGVYYDYYQQS